MRKVASVALAASLTAAAVAVPASAISGNQGLKVTVSPSKHGSKKKPANVKLKVTTTTDAPKAGEPAFATKTAVISFDKNLVLNGAKFKRCTADQLRAAESNCPSGSKVGGGTAQGIALGQTANLTVTAFNGPKGKTLLLHVVGSTPIAIDSVMVASLKTASGKYGKKLVVPIPDNLQQPITGVFATLTSFITTVKGTSKGVPYVGLVGCTKKKLNFKGVFTYTDGTSKTATSTAKCS
jgi:hypothetical protein